MDGLTVDGVATVVGTTTSGILLKSASGASNGFKLYNDSGTDTAHLNNHFSGSMVFSTNNTERMRIDASGNLLVGKTASSYTTDGFEALAAGAIQVSDTSTNPVGVNRNGTDGSLISFFKSGTSVGSIGTNVGRLSIGSGDTGVLFAGDIDAIYPANGIAARDSAIDLGVSGARFKNLYLSGKSIVGSGSFDGGGVIHNYGSDGNSRSWWAKTDTHGYGDFAIRQSTTQTGSTYQTRLLIDSSGNLLVGKTSTSQTTAGTVLYNNGQAYSTASGTQASVLTRLSNDGPIQIFYKDSSEVGRIGTNAATMYVSAPQAGGMKYSYLNSTNAVMLPVTTTGAYADGLHDLGYSAARFKDLYLSGGVISQLSVTSETEIASYNNNNATGAKYKISFKQNGTQVGVIEVGTSSTSYATSSDYRLKENVVGMSGATERLKQLKPSRFNFIADADTTVDGFLAHEVQDIVPEAISGTKDAMRDEEYEVTPAVLDDDGNVTTEAVMGTRSVPDYQGIDQSKLVPLLVATIQELEARITQLENN